MLKRRFAHIAALSVVGAFGASAAMADPPHCPPGHAKKGQCYAGNDYRANDRAYEQGYRDGQRDAEWRLGYRLPDHVRYDVIRDYDRYGFYEPPRGHYYARVDDDYLLVEAATQLVIDVLRRQ